MCFAFSCYGLRHITRGKKELPPMLNMKNGNMLFQRKNKSSCLFVLNISVQQVLKKTQCLRKMKRRNVCSSIKVNWAATHSRWTFNCLFHNCFVNLLEQFSLRRKKKSPPDCCLYCTYLYTPTYLFVLYGNKSAGTSGKWSGIFGVRLCHSIEGCVHYFQIKTFCMVWRHGELVFY